MYTKEDLLAVRKAKIALASGTRIGQVTVMGQVIRYESVTLKDLSTLESEIVKAIKPKRIRHVSLQYDKGA